MEQFPASSVLLAGNPYVWVREGIYLCLCPWPKGWWARRKLRRPVSWAMPSAGHIHYDFNKEKYIMVKPYHGSCDTREFDTLASAKEGLEERVVIEHEIADLMDGVL